MTTPKTPWSRAILGAIEEQGLSERQVSIAAVGHESAIRSLKRGVDPRASTLAALASELGLEFHVGAPRTATPALTPAVQTGAYVTDLSSWFGSGGVRFSAEGCAWFGAGVLTDLNTDPAFCRAAEVLDSAMAPTLPPASVALVDLQRTTPKDGGIFLVGRSLPPTLRRLSRDGAEWHLTPDNPAWPAEPLGNLRRADRPGALALLRPATRPQRAPRRTCRERDQDDDPQSPTLGSAHIEAVSPSPHSNRAPIRWPGSKLASCAHSTSTLCRPRW